MGLSREGDEGDHLEGGANLETSAAIVALASKLPAVVVERGVAGKGGGGGGGGGGKGSELGMKEMREKAVTKTLPCTS